MSRKTKEIELFGEKLILSERTAVDVLAFAELSKQLQNRDLSDAVYQAAVIVEAALKINLKNLDSKNIFIRIIRFLHLDKKYKNAIEFNSKLSSNYIINNLSQVELFEIVKDVYDLEGLKIPSVEESQEDVKKK